MFRFPPALALAALALAPLPAAAQTVLSGNHSVDGNLCVGPDCTGSETFGGFDDLKIKSTGLGILFDDVGGTSTWDWRIRTNDTNENSFWIEDVTDGTTPFKIIGTAPDNSLFVAANGDIGLGTSIPQAPLHVETTALSGIRLNRSNTSGGGQAWETNIASNGFFEIVDVNNNTAPLLIGPNTPRGSLALTSFAAVFNAFFDDHNFEVRWDQGTSFWADGRTGDIGMGTPAPVAPLHIRRSSTTSPGVTPAGILVEVTGTNTPRGLLTLRNNGNVFFGLENTAVAAGDNTGRQWNFQNNGGEFRVTTAPGGTGEIEMQLTPEGNMYVKGGYFVGNIGAGNTQLSVPDYVFAPDYDLKPLSEVQAFIETHSHLPEVPSAAQITETGLNMTQMQMTLLKKIEELTLYTLEQEGTLDAAHSYIAGLHQQLAQQEARLSALEAMQPD